MTQSLGLNSSNDLYLNSSGNLQVDTGLQALIDVCLNVSRALLGEMVLTINNGLPYFQAVFTGNAKPRDLSGLSYQCLEQYRRG